MKDYILKLDRPRVLKFAFLAQKKIDLHFGKMTQAQLLSMNMSEAPFMAWAGLIWEDSTLTEARVVELLDDSIPKNHTIMGINEIVWSAYVAHCGATEKMTANALKKAEKKAEKPEPVEKKVVTEPAKTIPTSKPHKK